MNQRVRKRITRNKIYIFNRMFCGARPLSKKRIVKLKNKLKLQNVPAEFERVFQDYWKDILD